MSYGDGVRAAMGNGPAHLGHTDVDVDATRGNRSACIAYCVSRIWLSLANGHGVGITDTDGTAAHRVDTEPAGHRDTGMRLQHRQALRTCAGLRLGCGGDLRADADIDYLSRCDDEQPTQRAARVGEPRWGRAGALAQTDGWQKNKPESARIGTPTANAADGDGGEGRSVCPVLFALDHDHESDGWMNAGCARAQGGEGGAGSSGWGEAERRGESDGAGGGDDQGRGAAGGADAGDTRATDRRAAAEPMVVLWWLRRLLIRALFSSVGPYAFAGSEGRAAHGRPRCGWMEGWIEGRQWWRLGEDTDFVSAEGQELHEQSMMVVLRDTGSMLYMIHVGAFHAAGSSRTLVQLFLTSNKLWRVMYSGPFMVPHHTVNGRNADKTKQWMNQANNERKREGCLALLRYDDIMPRRQLETRCHDGQKGAVSDDVEQDRTAPTAGAPIVFDFVLEGDQSMHGGTATSPDWLGVLSENGMEQRDGRARKFYRPWRSYSYGRYAIAPVPPPSRAGCGGGKLNPLLDGASVNVRGKRQELSRLPNYASISRRKAQALVDESVCSRPPIHSREHREYREQNQTTKYWRWITFRG
ncbi:predicted protein [Postia placenta Mad-698-R]|uniref:Uncharacterized protein n=1 Tax=Postia placenta MAD-698-R-SB12 TaxID=670580 RepID=A0A1X6MVK7_9APHY|nr:hypothetical protein POSPLADRAFT_1047841 [Postia placenta MAD-698-R-SB12]EED84702.1 predicted protein [Postia placenta Mad-698-R]OSX60391.1 hypothetical protein POSPLADRAFT_1047841 [Postia placenta MAD-698-R-SB12]